MKLTPNFDVMSNKVEFVSRKSVDDTNVKTGDIFQDYQNAIHRHSNEAENEGRWRKTSCGKGRNSQIETRVESI